MALVLLMQETTDVLTQDPGKAYTLFAVTDYLEVDGQPRDLVFHCVEGIVTDDEFSDSFLVIPVLPCEYPRDSGQAASWMYSIHKANPEALKQQIECLKQIKSERSSSDVKAALAKVKKAAQSDENLIPSLVEAAKAYATLGEIVGELKDVFGEHQESRNIF